MAFGISPDTLALSPSAYLSYKQNDKKMAQDLYLGLESIKAQKSRSGAAATSAMWQAYYNRKAKKEQNDALLEDKKDQRKYLYNLEKLKLQQKSEDKLLSEAIKGMAKIETEKLKASKTTKKQKRSNFLDEQDKTSFLSVLSSGENKVKIRDKSSGIPVGKEEIDTREKALNAAVRHFNLDPEDVDLKEALDKRFGGGTMSQTVKQNAGIETPARTQPSSEMFMSLYPKGIRPGKMLPTKDGGVRIVGPDMKLYTPEEYGTRFGNDNLQEAMSEK